MPQIIRFGQILQKMQAEILILNHDVCSVLQSAANHYKMSMFLAEHRNSIAKFGYSHNVLSLCRLSVTRVYCDKTSEK